MSQQNVEVVRRIVEDAVRGRLQESVEGLAPDAEWHGTVGGLTEGSVWRGREEIRKVFEQEDAEAWEERRLEAEEFIDAGDCVVVLLHEFRRGKGGGVEVEADTAVVYEVRNGCVVRIQGYMDRAEALEAAGLREQASSYHSKLAIWIGGASPIPAFTPTSCVSASGGLRQQTERFAALPFGAPETVRNRARHGPGAGLGLRGTSRWRGKS